MIRVFSDVVSQSRLTRIRLVTIDNSAFRIHYRLSLAIMLACTTLVCSRQYIGEHIRCIVSGVAPHVVNTFCFFTTTYTIPNANNSAHPGVGPVNWDSNPVRHAYYQWVPFVLFFQAVLFYLPHLLWKSYEAGTIALLVDGLQRLYLKATGEKDIVAGNRKIPSEATKWAKVRDVMNHLDTVTRFRINRHWATTLVGCEVLNLLNVLLQIKIMDKFLGGQFYSYGWKMFEDEDGTFDRVFPKMTKCDFHKFGPSGTIQTHDVLCVMALNIVNEKIYALLWFWFFFILLPVSVSALVWRLIQYALHSNESFNRLLLRESSNGARLDPNDLAIVAKRTTFSDWLFMYYLAGNMDSDVFRQLLHNFATGLKRETGSQASDDDLVPLGKNPL
ncbi:innexin inx7-like [Daktulosphaira vitifoliae]|uniref:innexin inx7-like n=1 Tax=Daktulosphaira vitifoliae TaxID=58002 RepID=UPI0021AA684F|nr:innexin inx7-like [Daktulosphaira vitifoliae]